MTYAEISHCVSDRFKRWGRFLRRQGATPVLVVGLRERDSRFVVTTVEELSNEQIAVILNGILIGLKAAEN